MKRFRLTVDIDGEDLADALARLMDEDADDFQLVDSVVISDGE